MHPTIFGGTMPVLHALRDGDDHAGNKLHRLLAPFLIPAATADANEVLHGVVMDMPVVAAARLKADVAKTACRVEDGKVTVADEVLGEGCIRIANGPW